MSGGRKKRFQDWRKMFRNRKERFRSGRRWLAIVLLPAIPAMAAGVMSGNRDIFWGQLAVEFYALFLLTAICSRDFAEVYQKLAWETPKESRGARKAKRWLCGAVYYTLWCGALFMIYLLG